MKKYQSEFPAIWYWYCSPSLKTLYSVDRLRLPVSLRNSEPGLEIYHYQHLLNLAIVFFVVINIFKVVDKLHFRGHKGAYCFENCNPSDVPEIKNVNTVVCEQVRIIKIVFDDKADDYIFDLFKTFNWLNKYKACKSMNESHFFFFLLYVADLHNLKIEEKLRVMCRPKVRGVEMANMARQKALAGVEVHFWNNFWKSLHFLFLLENHFHFLFLDDGGDGWHTRVYPQHAG